MLEIIATIVLGISFLGMVVIVILNFNKLREIPLVYNNDEADLKEKAKKVKHKTKSLMIFSKNRLSLIKNLFSSPDEKDKSNLSDNYWKKIREE